MKSCGATSKFGGFLPGQYLSAYSVLIGSCGSLLMPAWNAVRQFWRSEKRQTRPGLQGWQYYLWTDSKATEDIRQRVLGIQAVTGKTVSEINQVSAVIGDMNDIVSTIAAVEEQSTATREIAESVGQSSSGITELDSNVAKSSGQITSISKEDRKSTRLNSSHLR